jgi:hypothetical protein
MRDAKYLHRFTDDDSIFNCEDYYATLGEAKERLQRTGAKAAGKSVAKVTAKKKTTPVNNSSKTTKKR